MKPVIFGCAGTKLSVDERQFFADANPFGFILFQRNCAAPDQVRQLVGELRAAVGRADAPVFIDQEGGRVARLKPPHWPELPPLRRIGEIYERSPTQGIESMQIHARLTAHMLRELGINGNCAPVLDLFIEDASTAIGDRALSRRPDDVAVLGRVAVETFLINGVLPVIKHLPGHGRVKVDPHETLPVVETEYNVLVAEDFVPFAALKDAPIGMNCHVVFKVLDPHEPVSLSARVNKEIIRGAIGFEGLLFSDDLAMKALKGPLDEIARRALGAGADILLYCPGGVPEMTTISRALPVLSASAKKRWAEAQAKLRAPKKDYSPAEDRARLTQLLKD